MIANDKTITKEGIRVEAGQVWQDLDKRMPYRKIKITHVDPINGLAWYEGPPKGRVSIKRMHKHATGFSLIEANP